MDETQLFPDPENKTADMHAINRKNINGTANKTEENN